MPWRTLSGQQGTEEKDLGFPREQKASWDKGSEVWSCFLTRSAQTSHWDGFEVGLEGATQHSRLNMVKYLFLREQRPLNSIFQNVGAFHLQ